MAWLVVLCCGVAQQHLSCCALLWCAVWLHPACWQAFCAGGDVKSVALDVAAGNHEAAMAFFKAEYLMDAAISQLEVPHISLLDGITMGGGAGISMHGHFRVATEK